MGTAAQKEKLRGMSSKQAMIKLTEIFAKECTHVTLAQANQEVKTAYGLSLIAIAETWHRLRAKNKTIELMIQSFAESVSSRNKKINGLSQTIFQQRKQLEVLQNDYNALKAGKSRHEHN